MRRVSLAKQFTIHSRERRRCERNLTLGALETRAVKSVRVNVVAFRRVRGFSAAFTRVVRVHDVSRAVSYLSGFDDCGFATVDARCRRGFRSETRVYARGNFYQSNRPGFGGSIASRAGESRR